MNWQEVDIKTFSLFLIDENLREIRSLNNSDFCNEKGEILAQIQHTFVKSVFRIKTEKNYESLKFVTELLNVR